MSEQSKVVPVFKRMGETPLQTLERVRSRYFSDGVAVTYAGRLDPLAEGVLLLLSGDIRYKKSHYTSLPKEYIFDCLWGVSTDTHDVLGCPDTLTNRSIEEVSLCSRMAESSLLNIGEFDQKRPVFSSQVIKKDHHALRNMDTSFSAGSKRVSLYSVCHVQDLTVTALKLHDLIKKKISLVSGDFRQEEILSRWDRLLSSHSKDLYITRYLVRVSHGTYIRALVRDMGIVSGFGATTLHIMRSRVGQFSIYNTDR